MARVLRGDVVWAELDPTTGSEQAGRRPVLVLSEDVFNDRSGTVIAVAITVRSLEPSIHSRWSSRRQRCPKGPGSK
jgi:mRNA interferase MazF